MLFKVINECHYCVDHHYAEFKRLLANEVRADAIKAALQSDTFNEAPLSGAQKELMVYGKNLTTATLLLSEAEVIALRECRLKDVRFWKSTQYAPT